MDINEQQQWKLMNITSYPMNGKKSEREREGERAHDMEWLDDNADNDNIDWKFYFFYKSIIELWQLHRPLQQQEQQQHRLIPVANINQKI